MNWADFWNGDHAIYVNQRHKSVHYQQLAEDLSTLLPKGCTVLDYGCGEALSAGEIADHCGYLYLYDQAPRVRSQLLALYLDNRKIKILNEQSIMTLKPKTLDVIIANSLLQYLKPAEFEKLLAEWRPLLSDKGYLILADLLPPKLSALADSTALLRFAWRGSFFPAAFCGLVKTFFSNYRQLRNQLGLTRYAPSEIETLLAAHGYQAEALEKNPGHNQARFAYMARKNSAQ